MDPLGTGRGSLGIGGAHFGNHCYKLLYGHLRFFTDGGKEGKNIIVFDLLTAEKLILKKDKI